MCLLNFELVDFCIYEFWFVIRVILKVVKVIYYFIEV